MQEKLGKLVTFLKPHDSGLGFGSKKEKCKEKLKTGLKLDFNIHFDS